MARYHHDYEEGFSRGRSLRLSFSPNFEHEMGHPSSTSISQRPKNFLIKTPASKFHIPIVTSLPVREFTSWEHVGTLSPSDKRDGSHEGRGLSVSQCPDAWRRIARCSGLTHHMVGHGLFVDFHAGKKMWEKLGIAKGFLTHESRFFLDHHDEEGEVIGHSIYLHESDALAELNDPTDDEERARISSGICPVPTPLLKNRFSYPFDDGHAVVYALTELVQDGFFPPMVHGVYFDDLFDPAQLSAPRGVIVPRFVSAWVPRE